MATVVALAGPPTPPATVDIVPAVGARTPPAAAAGTTLTPAATTIAAASQSTPARDSRLRPPILRLTPVTSRQQAHAPADPVSVADTMIPRAETALKRPLNGATARILAVLHMGRRRG
jgi:hypothetical protein